jgi:hypothetical protein
MTSKAAGVVGERPRWQAIAPYVGIPIPTGAVFGGEAVGLPAVLSAIGLGGGAVEASTVATEGASEAGAIISSVAQEQANLGISGLSRYISASQLRAYLANPAAGSRFLGTAVHNATARVWKCGIRVVLYTKSLVLIFSTRRLGNSSN